MKPINSILFFLIFFYNLNLSSQKKNLTQINYNFNVIFENENLIHFNVELDLNKERDSIELLFRNPFVNKIHFKKNSLFKVINTDLQSGKKITIYSKTKIKNLIFDYTLKLDKNFSNRNYYFTDSHFFLLPDFDYLPEILNEKTKTQYKATVKQLKKFSYINEDSFLNVFNKPYILGGNFEIISKDSLTTYIPKNVTYNKKRLGSILNVIKNSYEFYKKNYGEHNLNCSYKVFFVNRTGGHGYPSGLLLDKSYLEGEDKLNNHLKLLIAHEVAHYWWGYSLDTNHSSLFEALSEYSAILYLENTKKNEYKKFYAEKNLYLENNQLGKINFDTITPYNNKNNLYRNFSYYKLPIIIKELETKVGKEKIIEKLSQLYNSFHMSDTKITYEDFINLFAEIEIQNELKNDLFGLEKKWTDFYVKNVIGNSVVYRVDGLHNKENIKVKLTDFKNNSHSDTIVFSKKNEISKEYPFQIKRVVIDPDFECNQKTSLNDIFDIDKVYSSNSKYGKFLDNKFYIFSDKIIEYLFYSENEKNNLLIDEYQNNKLFEIANKTRKINTNGFLIFVDEKSNILKLIVSFSSKDENILGYIQIRYFEKDGVIYLKDLDKIKL